MSIKNKRVLITGGAGFVGSNFVYKFLELGNKIYVFEKEGVNLWRIQNIKNQITIYHPNLLDYKEAKEIIKKIKPDIVLHFATYGAYQKFQQDINLTIDINLNGTINLINACKEVGVECFIQTGTSSEYGIKEKPMKETDPISPDNFYAVTKGATTMYCQMMAQKFNFPVVIMRLFAVYGPFEDKERLIPTIIRAYLNKVPPKLSNPKSVRDFIFIDDIVNSYILAIKHIKKVKGEIFNIGYGKQYNIDEVVRVVKKLTTSKVNPIYGSTKPSQTEPKKWVANISKAKKILNWTPKYSLESGIKKNIEWLRENLNLYG